MRFEPRVIPGDEPPTDEAGELLLPGDLQALADQLFDDAAHVAACYPAESSDQWLVERNSFRSGTPSKTLSSESHRGVLARRLAIVGSSLAALSLVVTATAIYWYRSADRSLETAGASVSSPVAQPMTSPSLKSEASQQHTPAVASPEFESSSVLFLQNVSAPQLEGYYDLIEQSGEDGADVSI